MKSERKYTQFDAAIILEIAQHPHVEDKEYKNFKYYSDSVYPAELIDKQRPNEHEIVKKYREETYQAVFSEVFDRVLNALNKIQRADGFYLNYPPDTWPKIAKDEDLETYLTHHFTQSKSLMNWEFQVGLKQYIIDANGVCNENGTWSYPTDLVRDVPYLNRLTKTI